MFHFELAISLFHVCLVKRPNNEAFMGYLRSRNSFCVRVREKVCLAGCRDHAQGGARCRPGVCDLGRPGQTARAPFMLGSGQKC